MKKAELDPNFTVDEALIIPSFHAINILNFGGRRQPAFLVKMLHHQRIVIHHTIIHFLPSGMPNCMVAIRKKSKKSQHKK
ncbi:hypothetical protein [Neobacillus vireti]|uniref:hypothetical protein n=1 Tax=Neobacillus vireti TaxID=220686 RepID=UPI003000EDAE